EHDHHDGGEHQDPGDPKGPPRGGSRSSRFAHEPERSERGNERRGPPFPPGPPGDDLRGCFPPRSPPPILEHLFDSGRMLTRTDTAWLEGLNGHQRAAVTHPGGPLLV